ncbi:uncharacterized protein ARMOST_05608 [Armillaria ostoyae]|uniref:Uncharacterized protein n=1 Tax=Armillaria ostoyae TaxID=47428 RepID=A0A284R0P5_ARMOS|nr:uncharacterized protein ARMOST_05608 [Armillaria ostoyae]
MDLEPRRFLSLSLAGQLAGIKRWAIAGRGRSESCGKGGTYISFGILQLIVKRHNYIFLQQHVRLTGLGCEAFKDAAYNILEAQLMFERHFPEGAFEKWTADNTDSCVGNDISNRYLETRKAYPQEEAMFEKGVDPKGILAAACTRRNLIHTEDNKVRFFTSSVDNEGERNSMPRNDAFSDREAS